MSGCLKPFYDWFKAVYGCKMLPLSLIVPANSHLLASKAIKGHIQFQAGIAGIFAVWQSCSQIIEGLCSFRRQFLLTFN